METVLSKIQDSIMRALLREVFLTGSALEAYHDGALGGGPLWQLSRDYDRAQRNLAEYKAGVR